MQLCSYATTQLLQQQYGPNLTHHTSLCAAVLYCKAVGMQKQQYATAKRHSVATKCSAAAIYTLQIGHHRTMQLLQATARQQATLLYRPKPW